MPEETPPKKKSKGGAPPGDKKAFKHGLYAKHFNESARLKQEQDGKKRVFLVDGYDIAAVHAPYRIFLEDQIARMGANHPIIRTQYLCQEIDAQSGMFNAARLALMQGDQPGPPSPVSGLPHAFLIDVAGQDKLTWVSHSPSLIIQGRDPLKDMDGNF